MDHFRKCRRRTSLDQLENRTIRDGQSVSEEFLFEAVSNRDYPVMFGTLYAFSLLGLVLNLISDLAYHWVDPRIDFDRREG